VKSRLYARSLTALALVLAFGDAGDLEAQPPRPTRPPPRADTPKMLVQVFGSADRVAGPAAADDLRDRLIRAYPSRTLWVIPKEEQIPQLEQSGFDKDQALSASDEAALAKILRADDYIRGQVVREGNQYRVQAHLVLTRDPALTQPLPMKSAARPQAAAAELVDEIKEARKQIANEKRCIDHARNQKYAEAVRVADEAIAEYPRATLVRYCKLNVLLSQKAANAQVIAMAEEILAIDSTAKAALIVASQKYKEDNNVEKANDYLVRLWLLEPDNAQLAGDVVDALAASGNWTKAKQVVTDAVLKNPGDIRLISMQFRVLAAARDFKPAIRTGEEMVQMDTSLANVQYFQQLAALYQADSQPAKVAEVYGRATAKFPDNAEMWQAYAQALKNAGQVPQSIAASRRSLQVNPQLRNGWTQIAVAYNELNFPDSALIAARSAKQAGDDANVIGQYVLSIGNKFFRAASADTNKTEAAFTVGLPYLYWADSTITDPAAQTNAKLLIGVSNFYIASAIAQGLQKSKSCDETKRAQKFAMDGLLYTQQGGRASPETAAQILGALNTSIVPYLEQTAKSLCK
jgi:tetratricopeptide (TPR) repeat protein